MQTKLTSVKVMNELYNKFKISCLDTKMTLQKLTNRALHLYTQNDDFKKQIDSINVSGSAY